MKQTTLYLAVSLAALNAYGESIMKPVNDQGYGTISGRVQWLTMYRDFDNIPAGNTGANSTLGVILGYTSPEFAGFDGGLAYNYAGEIYDNNNTALLANDPIHVLNEGWVRYRLEALKLTNTTVTAGRRINNGDVFRADDFRQKSRAIETVQLESADLDGNRFMAGHALRMSSWIQAGDRWDFNDFGDVFKAGYDTDGITWGEAVNTQIQGLEVALFDAYAWDVSNLIGTRAKWDVAEKSALIGYYRHEGDVGQATTRNSDAYGIALQQKIGDVTLEPGWFSVHGSKLRFEETTTGINHPLGASMMIYSGQFNGGADTAYLKAVTKMNQTVLYALYNYTWHSKTAYDGQELNVVVKQPIIENLTAALKVGAGYRDGPNTTASDVRLFITYTF